MAISTIKLQVFTENNALEYDGLIPSLDSDRESDSNSDILDTSDNDDNEEIGVDVYGNQMI